MKTITIEIADDLAKDAGMVLTRLGSWEGSNMATVLTSHGYEL